MVVWKASIVFRKMEVESPIFLDILASLPSHRKAAKDTKTTLEYIGRTKTVDGAVTLFLDKVYFKHLNHEKHTKLTKKHRSR